MHASILFAANLLSTTATNSKHFSIGPWIIVPILMVAALLEAIASRTTVRQDVA